MSKTPFMDLGEKLTKEREREKSEPLPVRSESSGSAFRQCVCGHTWVGGPQDIDENCPMCNPPNRGISGNMN